MKLIKFPPLLQKDLESLKHNQPSIFINNLKQEIHTFLVSEGPESVYTLLSWTEPLRQSLKQKHTNGLDVLIEALFDAYAFGCSIEEVLPLVVQFRDPYFKWGHSVLGKNIELDYFSITIHMVRIEKTESLVMRISS